MKLEVKKSPQLFRDDGRPVHPFDVLADWVRRMVELRTAEKKQGEGLPPNIYCLSLTSEEWEATKTHFTQFAYEAAVSPKDDPLRGVLEAFGIPLPEVTEGDEDDD